MLNSLFSGRVTGAELPSCGRHALHEALQQPLRQEYMGCKHKLKHLCNDKDLVDQYLWNLGSYCQYTAKRTVGKRGLDYKQAYKMLLDACPEIETEFKHLEKRQTSVAAVTVTSVAPVVTSTTAAVVVVSAVSSAPAVVSSVAPIASTTLVSSAAAAPPSSQALLPNTQTGTASTGTATATSTGTASTGTKNTDTKSNTGTGTASTGTLIGNTGTNSGTITASKTDTKSGAVSSSTTTTSKTPVSIAPEITVAPFVPIAAAPGVTYTNPTVSLPTTTYTGQAILTGACSTAAYTALLQSDGSYIAAPILGCADDNPQCCPSLAKQAASATAAPAYVPLGDVNAAMVAALNQDPITTCPGDYTSVSGPSVSGACCPVGFNLYSARLINQTPCHSQLASTLMIPDAVSQQILSLSAAIAASATGQASPAQVQLITDEIFALSLPLQNGKQDDSGLHKTSGGLPLGAKIGIGAGGGALLLAVAFLIFCICFRRSKRRRDTDHAPTPVPAYSDVVQVDTSYRKSAASTLVTDPSRTTWSPKPTHLRQGSESWTPQIQTPQPQQQYGWTPPPRTSLQPMNIRRDSEGRPISQSRTNYAELDGAASPPREAWRPVEVDRGETISPYDGTHSPPLPPYQGGQTYQPYQVNQGYGEGGIGGQHGQRF